MTRNPWRRSCGTFHRGDVCKACLDKRPKVDVPRLSSETAKTARTFRAVTVPAPPEDEGEDPDYGF